MPNLRMGILHSKKHGFTVFGSQILFVGFFERKKSFYANAPPAPSGNSI